MSHHATGEKTADQDFLERLDAAIGCMNCGRSLDDSVSDLWCNEGCAGAYAAVRSPHRRTYDYFEDIDEDGHNWAPDDLTDLEPVSWIRPPEFRLPRSTGDLEADQQALIRACGTVTTTAQQAACDLRQDDLDERRRQANAKNWRLPRSTADFRADDRACYEAAAMATTDAQRAACARRREDLEQRRKAMPKPPFPGHQTSWNFDGYISGALRDFPIISRDQAQRAADSILTRHRLADPDYIDATPFDDPNPQSFGARVESNLPGLLPSTITVRAPLINDGDAIILSVNGEIRRYIASARDGEIVLNREPDSGERPGAEITHAVVDETCRTPIQRALEARRNRNTGPAPRPGRVRGNVPGARR